jgi:hypothetical protein
VLSMGSPQIPTRIATQLQGTAGNGSDQVRAAHSSEESSLQVSEGTPRGTSLSNRVSLLA